MFTTKVDPDELLYHYTSYRTAVQKILPTLKLRFGAFAKMNDPRESKAWLFGMVCPSERPPGDYFLKLQRTATRTIKGTCKLLCFTRDNPVILRDGPYDGFARGFAHPRMWAQYARNHRGICLIIDRAALGRRIRTELSARGPIHHGSVHYADEATPSDHEAFQFNYDELRSLGLNDYLSKHVERHFRALFFRKAIDWSQEWEYRWLIRASDREPNFVSIDDSLRAICLGADFPKTQEVKLVNLCKELQIHCVRMWWRNGFPVVLPTTDLEKG